MPFPKMVCDLSMLTQDGDAFRKDQRCLEAVLPRFQFWSPVAVEGRRCLCRRYRISCGCSGVIGHYDDNASIR